MTIWEYAIARVYYQLLNQEHLDPKEMKMLARLAKWIERIEWREHLTDAINK